MTILVCGDRNWSDRDLVRATLQEYKRCTKIVVGGARGADTIAEEIGHELGLTVEVFPADWNRHGRVAGPIRNEKMLKDGLPDLVLAFHDHINESKGTRHMVNLANRAQVETRVVTHEAL